MTKVYGLFERGPYRQLLSATTGSLSAACAASSYFWVTPLIPLLKSKESPIVATSEQLSWLVAVIEIGDFFGTLPVGFLTDRFGRKKILILSTPIFSLTWLWVLFTDSIYVLILCRFLQGVIVGSIFTVLPAYLGEVSSPSTRGFVGNLVQIMWYLGIIYIYSFGPFTSYKGITIVCLIPPLVFMIAFYFCPETPNYYHIRGKTEKAQNIENWLRGNESSEIPMSKPPENPAPSGAGKWYEIFMRRKCRKALVIVHVIAFSNVIGVPAILTYCEDIFLKTSTNVAHYPVIMAVLTLIVALMSGALADRLGKKPLLIFSTLLSSILLFTGSGIYFFHGFKGGFISDVGMWVTILYPVAMSFGPGSLTYSLQAELFLNEHRGIACSILTLSVASFTFISLKLYKVIEDSFGLYMVYCTWGIVTFLSVFIIHFFVPETKGKTFEDIQELL